MAAATETFKDLIFPAGLKAIVVSTTRLTACDIPTSSAPKIKQIGLDFGISPNSPEACSDRPIQMAPNSFILVMAFGRPEQRTILTYSVAPEAILENPGPSPKFPFAEMRMTSTP